MMAQNPDGSLAMTTCHCTEFIQDFTFLFLGRNPIASPQGCGIFLPSQLNHGASSRFFGNRIYEAPRGNSVTDLMRQIGGLTYHPCMWMMPRLITYDWKALVYSTNYRAMAIHLKQGGKAVLVLMSDVSLLFFAVVVCLSFRFRAALQGLLVPRPGRRMRYDYTTPI